ncbi:MAG TPA: adenylate/guanylate cyclase domain-containing protein, partial [Candidatus Ozemobacteraceae bacterium]
DAGEDLLINYNFDPQAITRVSMFDVLQGAVAPAVFKNRIVIIGAAHSMSEERLFTPLGRPEFPPFIHAVVVSNYLSGTPLIPNTPWQGPLLATILLAIAAFMLAPHLQPLSFGLFSLLGTFGLLALSAVSLTKSGRVIDVTAAIAAIDLTFVFAVGMRYYIEQSDKLRIKNAFQHYVTASVVNEILKDPAKLNLHGEERCLSLFFSDIEGFTTLSEGLSPLIVVNLLNEYLTEMTDIIFKYDGLLDKYEGDAIMAVFGAPVDQADHAIRACRCALDSQKALAKMREHWRSEGKPELFVRIGINTGVVVVGNMGSRMRFDYTCIGDNVNLAARLETANKMFGTGILISGNTADLVQNAILCRFLGMVRVIGRQQAVPVYEVLARLDDGDGDHLDIQRHRKKVYEEALQAALDRNFASAVTTLTQYLSSDIEDRPARLLLERCRQYTVTPPPPEWDGIMAQDQK